MENSEFSNNFKNMWQFVSEAFKDFYIESTTKISYFFHNFKECMISFFNRLKKSDSFKVFGLGLIVAFASYFYVLITQHFTTPINGDFQLQGMTFIYNGYDDWHYFFKTGQFIEWDTSGLIGVSSINAYSFYYLFDPFFLILLIFPRSFLLQAQAIVSLFKLAFAALFFYHYLGCFKISKFVRKTGAISYAFCGWGWFYLWFFHFQEVITFLPLMLLGIEKIFSKKDIRMFILGSFLMGCTNFQFFAISLICCFIYAMFKWFATLKTRDTKSNFSILGLGILAFLLGIGTTAFILIPNYISIKSMPRVSNASYLDNIKNAEEMIDKLKLIFTWGESYSYKSLYPLVSTLFINTNSFSTTLFYCSGYDNVGINMYIYAPLVLMLIPSLFDSIKHKKWSHIVGFVLMVICLETPFIYYLSGLFANAYGRWIIFAIAMMVLFVCLHFDKLKKMPKWYLLVSYIVVFSLLALLVYKAKKIASEGAYNLKSWNTYYNYVVIYQYIFYAFCALFLYFRCTAKTFKKETLYLVAIEAVIMGNVSVNGQGFSSYQSSLFGGHNNTVSQTEIISELNKYDTSLFRVMNTQMTRSQPNLAMVEGYNGVGLFCSVYNYETEDFFNWSKVSYSGGWTLGIHEKRMNLDEFLGVKYYLVKKNDNNVPFLNKMFTDVTDLEDVPLSLKNAINKSDFKLYKNNYFVDLAFSYDTYLPSSNFGSGYDTNDNEINYLRHAIVDKTYYNEHKQEFDDLASEDINLVLKDGSKKINSSDGLKNCYYYTNWDPSSEGGKIRTISSNYSDKYVNEKIQEYLNGNENALDDTKLNNNTHSSIEPIKYPLYTIKNYVDYISNPSSYSKDSPEYKSQYEYYKDSNGVYSGRLSYLGIYPADTYQTNGQNLSYNSKIVSYISTSFEEGEFDSTIPSLDIVGNNRGEDVSKDNPYYVSVNSKFGYNIDFTLYNYDENNTSMLDESTTPWPTYNYEKITHDQHMQNNYSKSGDWKKSRGFYTNKPVRLIVGTLKETLGNKNNSSQNTNVTINVESIGYESYLTFKQDVDKQLENQVNITYKDANSFKYTSSYSKDKIVVLNVPYDKGWSLYKTYVNDNGVKVKEKVDYFKGQGGFIAYIGKAGEVNYELTYKTIGFNAGKVIAFASISSSMIIYGIYYGLDVNKKYLNKYLKNNSLKGK